MADPLCILRFKYGCDESDKCIQNKDEARISSIINASRAYDDYLHTILQEKLVENPDLKINYHKNCVSKYTTKSNVGYLEKKIDDVPPAKKLRRSYEQFDFRTKCLYCGENCEVDKDPKNPARWRPAYLCRTTVSKHGQPYKEYLQEICSGRNDDWAQEIAVRLAGSVSDLHAQDARYHHDCVCRFQGKKNLKGVVNSKENENNPDLALQHIFDEMDENRNLIWNSIELQNEYQEFGGQILSKRQLIEEIQSHFGKDIAVLSSPGYASIISFHHHTANLLKIIKDDEEADSDKYVSKVAKTIIEECKSLVLDRTEYQLNIDPQTAEACTSTTLMKLLSALSPRLNKTLPALMIGNMVVGAMKSQPTELQVALGILLRDSKSMLGYMHAFGVTSSYDEVLRFKKSAAVAATQDVRLQGITCDRGLTQIVIDNFDADIHSPNGKLSTHSLAMIVTQPSSSTSNDDVTNTIPRIKLEEMKLPIADDCFEIESSYYGNKKPEMDHIPRKNTSDEFIAQQKVSKERARHLDFEFLRDVLQLEKCPEYNGYNTKLAREQGHALRPKTNVVYLPMIDQTPSDPTTIITAMKRAKLQTEQAGQTFVVLTADQQLYKVAVHVMWDNPDTFKDYYLRLGGMHLLMSYIGSIGTLMADSGIVEVLSSAFGGVLKMLNGKKFPDNIRALRMLVEELLRPIFANKQLLDMNELQEALDHLSLKSRTSKLWVSCLIVPVLNIMRFVRAEREADWALHLLAVKEMLPLFFAANHINYARYALFYLRSMEEMPLHVQRHFLRGEHTMHHNSGIFNGIWSDMAIETTFMRHGHSKNGVIGITVKEESLKTWTYSIYACNKLLESLTTMKDGKQQKSKTHHKEEAESRLKTDSLDRKALAEKLECCIDPLQEDQHTDSLVNIATGRVLNHPSINVENALTIGDDQMKSFEKSWPGSFHETLHGKVITMASARKSMKLGEADVYDPEMIYARAMGLQCSSREYDAMSLMTYELSPYPPSMFDDGGQMREAKGKSTLKNLIKEEISTSNNEAEASTSFLDGCAVLWVIPWPAKGIVQDFLDNFRRHLEGYLSTGNVFLTFDRYNDGSIKESARSQRDKGACRFYSLQPSSILPQQKVVLTVSANKKQLIEMILADLMAHKDTFQSKLVITANDPVPIEVHHGVIIRRRDLEITHDEADTMIINQIISSDSAVANVVADDTDVFVLLCHFVHTKEITGKVFMTSPKKGRSAIDINNTVDQHQDVMNDLLSAHALTGCDTVAPYFGIGKSTALRILRMGKHHLNRIGDIKSNFDVVLQQATDYMLACYGSSQCDSLTAARQKLWSAKIANSIGAPKLATLPPTDEAFQENVARAHLQAAIWKEAPEPKQPRLDPLVHGWQKASESLCLTPKTVPRDTALVPPELLKMIKCSCSSSQPCKTKRCSCASSNMTCTMFCACKGDNGCMNPRTTEGIPADI